MKGNPLSDLMEAARTDLRCISINQVRPKTNPMSLTIAISSYNIAPAVCVDVYLFFRRRMDEFLRVSDLEVWRAYQ